MHLLMLTEYFPALQDPGRWMSGGVEVRCYYIARALAQHERVTVIASRVDGLPAEEADGNLRVLRVGARRKYSQSSSLPGRISFMLSAIRAASRIPADIVEGCTWIAYPPAAIVAARKRLPSVAFCFDVWQGQWLKMFGWPGLLGAALERFAWSRPWTLFNAISAATRDKLIGVGINPRRIRVAAPGIDVAGIDQVQAARSAHPSLCCVARLVAYKHIEDLIEATAALGGRFPDLTCTIIGAGPEERALRARAAARGVSDRMRFLASGLPHAEIYRQMKEATVFCLPSTVEGFGLVVAEAMACGTPVVCADIEALRNVTADGTAGMLVDPRNPAALADGIEKLLADSALRDGYARKGRAVALTYDHRAIAEATAGWYAEAIGRREAGTQHARN